MATEWFEGASERVVFLKVVIHEGVHVSLLAVGGCLVKGGAKVCGGKD